MFSQGYLIDTQLCIAALWLFISPSCIGVPAYRPHVFSCCH